MLIVIIQILSNIKQYLQKACQKDKTAKNLLKKTAKPILY